MLDDRSARLAMYVVSVRQGVFEQRDDRVDIVFRQFTDVFEYKGERFQTAIADVELGRAVFVEDGGDTGERSTGFSDDS
jgi:hypothetical protein